MKAKVKVKIMRSTREFIDDTKKSVGSGSNMEFFSWKDNKSAETVLHPATGFGSRNTHYFPIVNDKEEEKSNGKKVKVEKVFKERIICPGYESCPICQLRSLLKKDDDIDMDEVVIEAGSGKEAQIYKKGDAINEKSYDWKKDIGYKGEYVFGVVDVNDIGKGVQVAVEPKSLGKSISKEIEKNVEDEGENVGDPFITPYGFKFEYDPDESPAKQYSASRRKKIEITDEITELLEETDAVDIERLVTPTIITKIGLMVKSVLNEDLTIAGYDVDEFIDTDDIQEIAENKYDREWLKRILGESYSEYVDESKFNKKDDEEESESAEKEPEEEPKKNVKKPEEKKEEKAKKTTVIPKKEEEEEKPAAKKPLAKKPIKKVEEEKAEEEKPVVKKKMLKTPKKEEKPQIECPNCEKQIDEDATECKHCGAEFEDEMMIVCDECQAEIPSDSEKCTHCDTVCIPF